MPIAIADLSNSLASVVENTAASVVRVEGGRRPRTGIAWSPTLVVTAAHGLDRDDVRVGLEGGATLNARVRGRDLSTDLALLEVEGSLTPATFDDAAGAKVGQLALALGRPGQTVRATSGIISALARTSWKTPRGGTVDLFLESDAPHQPGFSGGPLVSLEGRVLGLVTTGIGRGQPIAIPTATLRRVLGQLEQHGRVRRSYLGLTLQPVRLPDDVREKTGEEIGLLVTGVDGEGPAGKAGLRYGDTVLHLGDESVKTLEDFFGFLRSDHADETVPVRYFRDGQVLGGQVTLGARPS